MPEAASRLTVIVPSVNGWGDLEGCLAALDGQSGGDHLDIIVADRVGAAVRDRVRARFPRVRLLEAPARTTIPALRRLAFAAATADVVGVIEDHVIVPPDWATRMLAAHAAGAQVVGGAVVNAATERLVDWAAFLCEYSHCLRPAAGHAEWLPGNNVTYRRALLARFADQLADDRWEDHLHGLLRAAGVGLECRPDIVVGHKKHYTAGEYAGQRFLYSRSFAGARVKGAGAARRALYGAAACALPPLLLARVTARVWRDGRHRGYLVASMPLLTVFVIAWAAGEVVGAWLGPGDALERVT